MKINRQVIVWCVFWCSPGLALVSISSYSQTAENISDINVASLSNRIVENDQEIPPIIDNRVNANPVPGNGTSNISVSTAALENSSLQNISSNLQPDITATIAERETNHSSAQGLVITDELEEIIRLSPNYDRYKTKLYDTAAELVDSGKCTVEDFLKAGGWKKSIKYKPEIVYYIYCQSQIRYFKPDTEEYFELAGNHSWKNSEISR